jgi:uncharacterized protein DUF3616
MRLPTFAIWSTLLLLPLAACEGRNGSHASAPKIEQTVARGRNAAGEVLFSGMCDASGAVALSERMVLVADDEDNVLRVYDADRGGPPSAELDLSALLELPSKPKQAEDAQAPEVDIEAAARIGERAYFVTSHGRNSRGKLKTERLRFFSTSAPANGKITLVGQPYSGLLRDLLAEPRLSRFELEAASELSPKAPGGLNIEGMTARAEGGVWLGFRNPIPAGRALLVPLLNPEGLVLGESARFGDPLTLDLGGLGIRALSFWRKHYLVAAGAFDGSHASKLFIWDGGERATQVKVPAIERYNPEALFTPEGRAEIMLLSDDGSRSVDGRECKRLKSGAQKGFRGLWFTPALGDAEASRP